MERLTKATDDLSFLCDYLRRETKFDAQRVKNIHDRLAAYEDTGLEPEEITVEPYGCVFYCNRKCNLNGDFCAEGPGCPWEVSKEQAKHLLELMDAEEQGRLVVQPCKTGDTINAFRFDAEKGLYVISDKVTAVSFNRRGYTVRTKSKFYPIREADGYTFASISKYPTALADFYIGSAEEAAAALGKEQKDD